VKAAFDALFQQIQLNALIRQSGGTPDPNAPKSPPPGATPTPGPTATVSLATPVPTPTPTPTPSGFGATPTPVPTKNYSPLEVTLTADTMTLNSTASSIQAVKLTASGQSALLIPDGNKVRVLAALPGLPDIDPGNLLGGKTVDGMQAMAVNGTTAYTIGNVDGVLSLITLTVDSSFQASATSVPLAAGNGLTAMTKCSGMVWISIKNALFASDPDHHTVVKVDTSTGGYTLYAGINTKGDTPGVNSALAAGFGLNTPAALYDHDSNLWICDSGNHRLLTSGNATDQINVYSGKHDTAGSVAGPTVSAARYQKLVSMVQFNNMMILADADDNDVRVLNLDNKHLDSYIITGPKTDNNQFIFKCRMVAELNGHIYAANGSGKIVHFDIPTLPN
jgi:hypothetical protein